MIFSHNNLIEPIDKKELSLELSMGSLFLNFNSKIIYSKNLNSTILDVGDSKRELTQFDIYEPGVDTKNQAKLQSNVAIVQFTDINGNLRLTTKYQFIYINQIKDTDINTSTIELQSYLGFNSTSKLINKDIPAFNVIDLYDVDLTILTATQHNYVLTSTSRSNGVNLNKNYFTDKVYYTWSLKPEVSRIPAFDDVHTINNPLDSTDNNRIIRTVVNGEGISKALYVDKLKIAKDTVPELAGDLDCLGSNIYNQCYSTFERTITTPQATRVCNIDLYKVFTFNCNSSVLLIKLEFSTALPTTRSAYIPITLIFKNFTGAIGLGNNVELENGQNLVLEGKQHIINALITVENQPTGYGNNSMKLRILQKSTNLTNTLGA